MCLPCFSVIRTFNLCLNMCLKICLLFKARNPQPAANDEIVHSQTYEDVSNIEEIQHGQWKRIMLLVIAITVHNIPEGLAVGVGFGAIGRSTSATFESAR